MEPEAVILSSHDVDTEFAELSRRDIKTTGKLFRKQIFRFGEFSHPANPSYKITVDDKFYEDLKRNFDNRVCPIVQVPLADDQNRHVEAPDRNIGEVVDLGRDENGIYALIDVRKHAEDIGSTLLGISAKMSLNYTDTRTNQKVGPTLLHAAVTNRPFLVDLDDFENVSMSNDDTTDEVVLLTNGGKPNIIPIKENNMNKEEAIVALSEYGIDVEAGQKALADLQGFVALSDVLGDDVEATPATLSTTIVDLTTSIKERDEQIEVLQDQIEASRREGAEKKVDSLIEAGRIRPVTRDAMIEMELSNPEQFELFLIPENEAHVELSEQGVTSAESSHEVDPAERAKAEGQRLADLAKN